MNVAIFKCEGALLNGQHLAGAYRWRYPVRLMAARLDCRAPVNGVLALWLELGGVLTAHRFTVLATAAGLPQTSADDVTQEKTLGVLVPANTVVRFKATFSGTDEGAAMGVGLTIETVPQSFADYNLTHPALTVDWISGGGRLTLFTYDPSTHRFTEASPGISAGRATITDSSGQDVSIRLVDGLSTEVMKVAGGIVYVDGLVAIGALGMTKSPRLAFMVGGQAVAQLSSEELRVKDLTEAATEPPAFGSGDPEFWERFEFWSGGQLVAALAAAGLNCKSIREPVV